jgi:hypothetical protein
MADLGALAKIPGYGAYVARTQMNENAGLQDLQQIGALMQLQNQMQAQKAKQQTLARQQQYQTALSGLGPNPDQAALIRLASQYASPDDVLKIHQGSLDRQAGLDAKKDADRIRLEQQAQQNEMMHQFRVSQTRNAEERNAEIARHNRAMEGLQAEFRRAGLQTRREQQVTAFANEIQQNKLPNLSASLTSANDLLRKYEGQQDIPGLGVVEGSKWIPGFMRSKEGANVKSALQAVSNDLLNLYSGLAVTVPESERRELEMMATGNFSEANFKDAWQRTVNRYNTVIGNMGASVSPEILGEYQGRPGAMSLKPLTPAFAGETTKPGTSNYKEGQTATGPGGKKIIFRGGKWQPM